jgi:protoporphyrinogen IX oxidase
MSIFIFKFSNSQIFKFLYEYLKSLHIIFIVTWFAGLFYMPRLFIYATEAGDKNEMECKVLREQFSIMMKRLWYGITWPSAILTLIFGRWLLVKIIFVLFLYVYHFSLHRIFKQEIAGIYRYSSNQLRIWNEVATIFLISIVMLVVVKQSLSFIWGLVGLILFVLLLMSAIRVYKRMRK